MYYLFDFNIINIDIQFTLLILLRILNNNKLDLLILRKNLLIFNQSKSLFKLHLFKFLLFFRSVIDLSENSISFTPDNTILNDLYININNIINI